MSALHDNLMRLTREELSVAVLRLGGDPETMTRKLDLARAVEKGLKERPLTPLFTIGPEGAMLLRKLVREGVTPMDTLVRTLPVLDDSLRLLRGYGLVWHTRCRWELTPQAKLLLMTLTKEQLRLLRYHDSLYTTIHGCLNLYGMLEMNELLELLRRAGWRNVEEGLVLSAYIAVCPPREVTFIPEGSDSFYLCTDELDDPAWLYGELQRSPRPTCAMFSQDDFLRADALPGAPECFLPLQQWLHEEGASDAQIERLLYDLVFCYLNDPDAPLSTFADMLMEYARHGKPALLPAEEEMLLTLLEHLPLWTRRGHSIQDDRRIAARQSAADRDDYCPCGSGRKYRHCCGNFH